MSAPVLFMFPLNMLGLKGETNMKKGMVRHRSWMVGGLIGTAVSLLLLLGMICGMTGLVLNESMQEGTAGVGIVFCVFLASFIGGIVAVFLVQEKKLAAVITNGAGVILALFMLHFLLFSGAIYGAVWTLLAALIGSFDALLVGNTKKGRGHHRIKKYRFG